MKQLPTTLAVWLLIIFLESVHGVLRKLYVAPVLGELRAKQIGVPVGAALIFLVALVFRTPLRLHRAQRVATLLVVGLLWSFLTFCFEITVAVLLLQTPVHKFAAEYNASKGGWMAFGLAFMTLTPLLVSRLCGGAAPKPEAKEKAT